MIRILAIVICAALLGACETAPINVGPRPDIAAIRIQNETTTKHIRTFTDTNKKTQVHIKKIQDEAIEEAKALDTAKRYLDELLGDE